MVLADIVHCNGLSYSRENITSSTEENPENGRIFAFGIRIGVGVGVGICISIGLQDDDKTIAARPSRVSIARIYTLKEASPSRLRVAK
jgi:hypothetical protein